MTLTPTCDPSVFIESQEPGSVTYRRVTDGRRWRVDGTCNRNGACLIGAVIDGEKVHDHAHLAELCERLGTDRPDSPLDVPVSPEFRCCPFTYVELEAAPRKA